MRTLLVRSALPAFVALAAAQVCIAQQRSPVFHPAPIAKPLILREHASGGEGPLLVATAAFAATSIADILTAPRSARIYNELHPETGQKSPGAALAWSVAGTLVPIGVGLGIAGEYPGAAGSLIAGGLLLGPSAGHFYAGRPARGFKTVAVRIGLAVAGLIFAGST